MIMAGDFRKGVTVEIDGQVWSVVDFSTLSPVRAPRSYVPALRTL